uniref:Putative secreted metalloprotease n=1 Tax=Ixodes ricinus TaxID=34613 RepID=A0A6B0VB96_IXORI
MGSSRFVNSAFLVTLYLSAFIAWVTAATVSSLRNQKEFDTLEHHKMSLGVQILYDDMFLRSNVQLTTRVNQYLLALLNAAGLRFADMANPVIELTLTKTTKVLDDILVRCQRGALIDKVHYYHSLQFLKDGAPGFEVSFEEADIVLMITGQSVEPPTLLPHGSWIGRPTVGGVCTRDKIGLLHDDGVSFSGAVNMAQQIAFLLGAVEPLTSDGSLLSQPGGGSYYYGLNQKGKKAILEHYKKNHKTERGCWNDRPRPIVPKYPVDFLLERLVDICTATHGPPYHECKVVDGQRITAACRIACCLDGSPRTEALVPDGAACGPDGRMCIRGWCIDRIGDYISTPGLLISTVPGGTAYDWDRLKSQLQSENEEYI